MALSLLGLSCAAGEGSLRQPRLTNPPRVDAWLGPSLSAAEVDPVERKYGGGLLLPLSEDWTWGMPDDGHWAITRLELGRPALSGERLLVGNSRQAGVFVLDRLSGQLLRHVDTSGPVQARPVELDDGHWLVVDTFGQLSRWDADLKTVWTYDIGGAVTSEPVVVGDRVLVGTEADAVVAVGLGDGAWQWTYRREVARGAQDLAILGAPSPRALGDSQVLAGFSDGAVVALQADTGVLAWEVAVGTGKFPDIQSDPVVAGDAVYVAGFGGPVVAIDAQTHRIRWEAEDAGAVGPMVFAGGYLYTSGARGQLHCLDPATGKTVWTWKHKDAQLGAPVRAGGTILVGDTMGTLHAVDRFTGEERWTFRPADGTRVSGVAMAPVVDGRQVLFASAGGTLWSLVADRTTSPDLSEEPGRRADRQLGW